VYTKEGSNTYLRNELIFLERGINISVRLQKKKSTVNPFIAIRLSSDTLRRLKDALMIIYGISKVDACSCPNWSKGIIVADADDSVLDTFKSIDHNDDSRITSDLIYLISKIENNRKIIESIYISAVSFFSDKVRNTIEKDLSKRWTLAIIADEFNVSEITIRKRLESEYITFNQILMQSRMSKAALLLLDNSYQISQISNMIGFSSTSYFIRLFVKHFGITPKQFLTYFKSQ
ncbi:TPA: aggregative adherence transcriptional regulator AggR, partial [Escherichia coli]|nr:aggregative adherence transcriptional regulator AggR [Escherichia coli]EFI3982951.1 aggregative adherence transcriptional regulator AggR [Escherichia coli]EFI5992441.1 aggregative adherence transcriptional regulator AggR [Escherichia coli]EHN6691319.1 aggregative adherence transcriptional regulator AggR [Escherichia coli]HAN9186961.1 aggregative adherence transcriptional regulator AggR [Escherichia coli]